jgi:CubicO group peptidase (beta-lactamase class C family)
MNSSASDFKPSTMLTRSKAVSAASPDSAPHRKLAALSRRSLLGGAYSYAVSCAVSSSLLAACGGGGEREELLDPRLLQEPERLREQAETAVSKGLVGVVFASQHQGAERLRVGAAGLNRKGAAGTKLRGDESFQLASLGKAMTAALAAALVEQGLLRWDSRPAELMPELAATQLPVYSAITLQDLLDHKGGLLSLDQPQDIDQLQLYLAAQAGPLPQDERGRRRLLSKWMLALPPLGRPGLDFVYSNAGYTLAGAMLEAASGKSFDALIDEHLARPLGLQFQWTRPTEARQPVGHSGKAPASLLEIVGYPTDLRAWFDAIKPAGNASMPVASYGNWLRWHQLALQGKSTPLARSYVERISRLEAGQYALGWQGSAGQGQPLLVHSGADEGFMGLVLLAQNGERALFGLSNTLGTSDNGTSWVLDALNEGLLKLL